MRRRLTLVIVGVLTGSLLLAGAGSLLVNRATTRHNTERQLLSEATGFADAARSVRAPKVLAVATRVLHLDHGTLVVIARGGRIASRLPSGLSETSLRTATLLTGAPVTGSRGTLAFAAVPISLSPGVARLLLRASPAGLVAVVVTRRTGVLGSAWAYFLLAAGVSLVVGAAVAAALSRRISMPLVEASTVARRIAGGELSARMATRSAGDDELASLASSINSMAAGLEDARLRESRLLLSVSHDLRTPLTSVRGYAEAIRDGVVDDSKQAADVIITATRRLERLVADLLELAKLDSDHLSLHLGPTDLVAVVRDTIRAAEPAAALRGIELSLVSTTAGAQAQATGAAPPSPAEPPSVPAPAMVVADPDRLAQVVGNLLENSIEFARTSVRLTVTGDTGDRVQLLVEDDGRGIPPGHLARVFDRFYQVDHGASSRGGSGLGLSIVSELLRAMGGAVRAESPLGADGGTRMVVSLARERPPPAG